MGFRCLRLWGVAFNRILQFGEKQAPKQAYLTWVQLFMYVGWRFKSQLVLRCTNRHQNKPILSRLCLQGGAFTRNLHFGVQTGTKQAYLSC